MKIFHERVTRTSATNQGVVLATGHGGRVILVAASNQTTGYRSIPFYGGPAAAQFLAGVGAVAGSLDPSRAIPLVPDGGNVQGGITEWLGWHGSFELKGDTVAVIFDITSCALNDEVECLVGIE